MKKVDRYAKREKLSRSGFFALAATRLLGEVEGEEITRRINVALREASETPDEQRDREMFQRSSARTIRQMTKDDQW